MKLKFDETIHIINGCNISITKTPSLRTSSPSYIELGTMRLPGLNNNYSGLARDESDATRAETHHAMNNAGTLADEGNLDSLQNVDLEQQTVLADHDLPSHPPIYDDLPDIEPMEMEDQNSEINNENIRDKLQRYVNNFNDRVIIPVKLNVMDPLVQLNLKIQENTDYYINKIGNPIILRRLFYIILMSAIAFYVMSSGLMPNNRSSHFGGMFSDHEILLQYARQSMDLSKLERDLEYVSSMEHLSGTKGDIAIANYIEESMNANNLKIIKEFKYMAYSDYPTGNSTLTLISTEEDVTKVPLNINNFNTLSPSGDLQDINIVYGYKGSRETLEKLKQNGYLNEDHVLVLQYDLFINEQILIAEQYGAKAILFISEKGEDNDLIQQKSASLPQFGTGDILTPGYNGPLIDEIDISDAQNVANIPVMPLSYNQGKIILDKIDKKGVQFQDGHFSGDTKLKANLKVDVATRERQPVFDIIGKIEGREQNDKAIVIGASRTSANFGAQYPGFGTAVLLSLIQICQEIKYKYDWKPLRNIYFISFGGNEFNFAGATELIEERMTALRDETFSFIDISQVGLWDDSSENLNIQTHPLLHEFFNNIIPNHGFNINVEHIQQYGDWIPYLANGIPSTVIANPSIQNRKLPIDTKSDTFDNIKDLLHDDATGKIAEELLLYLCEVILKLSDHPYIQFDLVKFGDVMLDVLHNLQNEIDHKLNTDVVEESLSLWKRIGLEWDAWIRQWSHIVMIQDGIEPSLISVSRWTWNRKLSNIGRRQLSLSGLIDRPFFKNALFSPTMWTGDKGNGHWTFPGVRDAVDKGDWEIAQEQMDTVANVLKKSAEMFMEENDEDNVYH